MEFNKTLFNLFLTHTNPNIRLQHLNELLVYVNQQKENLEWYQLYTLYQLNCLIEMIENTIIDTKLKPIC